jgi:inner membrane transporter RhtA
MTEHYRRQQIGGAGYLLIAAGLVQWSAAIVMPAFSVFGASATSAMRFAFGAIALLLVSRPRILSFTREQWLGALALGASVACMNQCFYQAIARIPLGGAVAIEFLGPLFVAAFGKRTWRHVSFAGLAAIGVLLITRPGSGLALSGILFALFSGIGWGIYIYASHHVGGQSRGFGGLAVSLSFAALLTLPFAIGRTGEMVHHPGEVLRVAIVGVMALALGFAAEMQALRRLKPSSAGVLMALDPVMAMLAGFLLLHQRLGFIGLLGLGFVVVAGAGVTYDSPDTPEPQTPSLQ